MQIDNRFARPVLAVVVLLVFAFAAGCSRNPLVGKWSAQNARGVANYTQFNSDGTWSSSVANGRAKVSGNYKTDKDTVTLTQTITVINGIKMPQTSQIAAPQVMTYKVDGNTLTVSNNGREVHLTRTR